VAFSNQIYTTLDDVHLNLDPYMGTTDDLYLSRLIEQAQSLIDSYVGYSFQLDGSVSVPATRVYNGNESLELIIDPCQQITQVQFIERTVSLSTNNVFISGQTQTFDITADCILGPNRAINNYKPGYSIKRITGIGFDQGMQNFVVSGVFGYTSVPPLVQRAATRVVCHWFKMRDTNYADVVTETGAVREHYTKILPPDVIELLELFKHRTFVGSSVGAW
jgi:hypothetical protein